MQRSAIEKPSPTSSSSTSPPSRSPGGALTPPPRARLFSDCRGDAHAHHALDAALDRRRPAPRGSRRVVGRPRESCEPHAGHAARRNRRGPRVRDLVGRRGLGRIGLGRTRQSRHRWRARCPARPPMRAGPHPGAGAGVSRPGEFGRARASRGRGGTRGPAPPRGPAGRRAAHRGRRQGAGRRRRPRLPPGPRDPARGRAGASSRRVPRPAATRAVRRLAGRAHRDPLSRMRRRSLARGGWYLPILRGTRLDRAPRAAPGRSGLRLAAAGRGRPHHAARSRRGLPALAPRPRF